MRGIGVVVIAVVALALGAAAGASAQAGSFRQRANMECAAAGLRVEHLGTGSSVRVFENEVSIASMLVRELRRLTPPASQAKKFKLFISQVETEAQDVTAALKAAREGRQQAATADFVNSVNAGIASDRTANALHLPACAANYAPRGG